MTKLTKEESVTQKIDLETLSDDAKAIAGVWFGLMKPNGDAALTLHLIENKPAPRTQAALDELVAARVVSVKSFNKFGGLVYRPLVDCHPAYRWSAPLLLTDEGERINWQLMEPVQ